MFSKSCKMLQIRLLLWEYLWYGLGYVPHEDVFTKNAMVFFSFGFKPHII